MQKMQKKIKKCINQHCGYVVGEEWKGRKRKHDSGGGSNGGAASQWNNIPSNAERNPLKTKAQWKAKATNGVQCSCEGKWKRITYLRKCRSSQMRENEEEMSADGE